MADNFIANPGAGGDTFAADDVGGIKYPYSKIDIGADGVSIPVTASNPLPVSRAGGATSLNQNIGNSQLIYINSKLPSQINNRIPVTPSNVVTKFRDSFEAYTPGAKWLETKANGDIVMLGGNAIAANYLIISKSPLTQNTVTEIETVARFAVPFEANIGVSMSQRNVGREFSIEVVDDGELTPVPDVAISSISQAATVLTVNTAVPHGRTPGMRISIAGVSDSRFNYPALVVASTPSPTQFTCTGGPGGVNPSVTAGPFTTGTVYSRSALGGATNGASVVFENALSTSASFYIRSDAGDALPSGTVTSNHGRSVATTVSVQAINSPYTDAFQPSSEYRVSVQPDKIQWDDNNIDGVTAWTNRYTRTQVVPNPTASYKLRIRATNNASVTVPTAQIVSVSKSGTTTATIVFDRPHNMTTADLFVAYGVANQVNFANLATATAVASVVNATTITAVWTGVATATSYGGYVAKVNGGGLMSALGQGTVVCQSVTLTNGILTLIGSGNWTLLNGNIVEVYGVRNDTNGTSLGVDGAYRVRSVATTTLELERADGVAMPFDFFTFTCGGAVIARTSMLASFVRVIDSERMRIEHAQRGDEASGMPVNINNVPGVVVNSGTVTATVTNGTVINTPVTPTTTFVNSAATTNALTVKASAGTLWSLVASNTNAATRFLKLHNIATLPVPGTTPVAITLAIPSGGTVTLNGGSNGIRFAAGIGQSITAAAADADTTVIAAGDVKVAWTFT